MDWIHSTNSLSAIYVLGTILTVGDTVVKISRQKTRSLLPWSSHSNAERQQMNKQ